MSSKKLTFLTRILRSEYVNVEKSAESIPANENDSSVADAMITPATIGNNEKYTYNSMIRGQNFI